MENAPTPYVLCTPRLVLRPLEGGDRRMFIRVQEESRDHLAPWSPAIDPGETLDATFAKTLERSDLGFKLGVDYRFSVWDDGVPARLVGMFNLNNVVRGVFQNAFAGWWLGAASTGKGYGFEALSTLLDFAFLPAPLGIGLHRVQANIIPTNERSLRLAARAGFREEGLARSYLKIAGEWQDHIMCAKLAGEHNPVFLRER